VNISALAGLWYSLLQKDPSMAILQPGIGIINYEFFRTWIDTQPEQELAKCLNSDFFIEGLRKLIVADLAYAQFLTHMRRRLFDYYNEGQPEPIWAEELALALAEQGFITEYAACETPEETTGIAKMLRTAQGASVFECALLACYRPLNSASALAKALRKNPSTALRPIIQQQIEQPRQESVLAITVKSIGGLKDRISAKVRKQYEENPYPRWISIGRVQMNNDMVIAQNPDYARAQSILVAGCGTGSHLLSVALMHPGAMVTGLDLSRASLAYARRKSEEMGIKNVRLIQGDLQNVVKLKQEFDIIESVGVLHHLADPEKGWQALAAVLKPRGLMKIGLYSSTARKHIIDCQKWLDDRDIPPTPEGIRQARKILIDLPDDHPFKSMTGYFDFYTTSMVRDFLFHVQEHNFSIERIRDDIGNLGLSFIGFSGIGRKMAALYREAYPMDTGMTDLANWAAFEQAHPQCFIGMYVFWCRKEGK
jgi:SAM-dependent methyltransferase